MPIVGKLLTAVNVGFRELANAWHKDFTDIALGRYSVWNLEHYAPEGRAYTGTTDIDDKNLAAQWQDTRGRIKPFISTFKNLAEFSDGEVVLDAGCGLGQNLKELQLEKVHLVYRGFDVDPRSIAYLNRVIAIDGGQMIKCKIEQGNLLDHNFREQIPSKSVDHVICSHVFTTLLAQTYEETRHLRKAVAEEMVRWARKSVWLIDSISIGGYFELNTRFYIEQLKRGFVEDDLIPYFSTQPGVEKILIGVSNESKCLLVLPHAGKID